MLTEDLSELLGRVSENSASQIDDLVGDFERLREKLRTDGDRIQREIEEYGRLSQQVMQLTKTIFENVEKDIPPGHIYPRAGWFSSMERVKSRADFILPSHDMRLFSEGPAVFP